MRVLIVSHGHPEEYPGGGEIAAYTLFQTLKQQEGVEPYFLARTGDPSHCRVGTHFSTYFNRPDEILLHSTETSHFLFSQLSKEVIREFAEFIENLAPDVVHFHHYVHLGVELIAVVRRILPNCRILMTLHEFLAICNHNGQMVKTGSFALCSEATPSQCARCFSDTSSTDFFMRQQFIQSHFDNVDQFITPSEFLRQRYIQWGIPAEKIIMLENLLPQMAPVPPRALAAGERRSVIAYFGQINPYKGIRVLIDAFEILDDWEGTENIQLSIFGPEPVFAPQEFKDWFKQAVKQNPKRIRFQGRYRREDLPRLMGSIDWVVMSSIWWENSPVVIQEALAAGRPVICPDIGGMAEKVTDGVNGLHFQAGNSHALAEAIRRAAAGTETWEQLAAACTVALSSEVLTTIMRCYSSKCSAVQKASNPSMN